MKTGIALGLLVLVMGCTQPTPPNLRGTITRAQLDTVTTPLLLAEIPLRSAQATLVPWGENAGVTTWRTADNVSLSFRDGVITSTRGLGDDLMSSDVRGTIEALKSRAGGDYTRHGTYLDGENQIIYRSYLCEMQPAQSEQINSFGVSISVSRLQETCYSLDAAIENTYWIGSDGLVWRSRQWLGGSLGYLTTERLVR